MSKGVTMTAAHLRAATVVPNAMVPVLVELEPGGERRVLSGWRLEGKPNGNDAAYPPEPPTPHVLVLECGQYTEEGK